MKDFNKGLYWTIKSYISTIVFLVHAILLMLPMALNLDLNSSDQKKVSIKLKPSQKVRDLGKADSKHKKVADIPSKKEDGNSDIFKKFAISKNQGTKNKPKKEIEKEVQKTSRISKRRQKINFTQRQIMQEAVKAKREENPLLNDFTDYNVKFIPPKGISPDKLNEFEKVFYSFFKRIASQYISSVHTTILDVVDEKPYVKGQLQKHSPEVLTARVVYDEEGNAEKITILKSSESDEIHEVFEKALKKMTKIPNVAKALKDENGKYTAFFQLGINQRSRN